MSNISSLNDLKKKKDDKDKRNELFVGGLDQRGGGSGLSVLGPPPNREGGPPTAFDELIQKASSSQEGQADDSSSASDGEVNKRTITMYQNGFTVDDGPLRDLESPESREFLSTLQQGRVPLELITTSTGRPNNNKVDIHLMDKRSEIYTPPPPPAYIAFSGTGATLRGESKGESGSGYIFTEAETSAIEPSPIDDSKPVTTLQVRALNGKKLKIKINQDASILQLAAMIHREGAGSVPYVLSSGFPPQNAIDCFASIKEAGWIGAAITQKAP
eukprot:gene6916-9469_t